MRIRRHIRVLCVAVALELAALIAGGHRPGKEPVADGPLLVGSQEIGAVSSQDIAGASSSLGTEYSPYIESDDDCGEGWMRAGRYCSSRGNAWPTPRYYISCRVIRAGTTFPVGGSLGKQLMHECPDNRLCQRHAPKRRGVSFWPQRNRPDVPEPQIDCVKREEYDWDAYFARQGPKKRRKKPEGGVPRTNVWAVKPGRSRVQKGGRRRRPMDGTPPPRLAGDGSADAVMVEARVQLGATTRDTGNMDASDVGRAEAEAAEALQAMRAGVPEVEVEGLQVEEHPTFDFDLNELPSDQADFDEWPSPSRDVDLNELPSGEDEFNDDPLHDPDEQDHQTQVSSSATSIHDLPVPPADLEQLHYVMPTDQTQQGTFTALMRDDGDSPDPLLSDDDDDDEASTSAGSSASSSGDGDQHNNIPATTMTAMAEWLTIFATWV